MNVALESSNRLRRPFYEIVNLLRARPGRWDFAMRLALTCALTTLIVEVYQTPDPALTVYMVFFLNKPERVESLALDILLTLVITFIVALLMLFSMLVIDAPLWRVAVMSAFSVGFLTVAFASKLRPVAPVILMMVGYGLDVISSYQSGEPATRAVLYIWLFIAIPAGVSAFVNLALAPSPRRLAESALAFRLRIAGAMLLGADEVARRHFTEALREGSGEIQGWLARAGVERTSPPRDLAALRQATQSTAAILAWVNVVDRCDVAPLSRSVLECLAQTFEDMAQVLDRRGYPLDITLDAHGGSPLPPAADALWSEIQDLLRGFAEVPAAAASPAPVPAAPRAASLFDLLTNPDNVRHALKTTGAAMTCYVLYSLLDWRGIHTCFITCYIASLGTNAETVEKLVLRIGGCLVGAAAGLAAIVYVVPSLTSIGALLTIVFLVALVSAWVAAGTTRISYAGFQIAFAFFLCVIQGPAPAFDLSIARDRIVGILLGNVMVYLFFTRLWPVSVADRIDPAIIDVLHRLNSMAAAATALARRALAMEIQGALGSIAQDLSLLRYEPATLRPPADWMRSREYVTQEITAIQAPLLLSASRDPDFAAEMGQHLEQLTAAFEEPGRARTSPPEVTARRLSTAGDPLLEMIRVHVSRLEEAFPPETPRTRERDGTGHERYVPA